MVATVSRSSFVMQLQISRTIVVQQVDQPPQLCYGAGMSPWPVACLASEREYCSMTGPEYGCTTNLKEACTKLHMCNMPDSYAVFLVLLFILLLVLLVTGCFWCCFCCLCGRCCRKTCPCFTHLNDRISATSSLNFSATTSANSRDMYAGSDHVLDTSTKTRNSAATNTFDEKTKGLTFNPMPQV